ncbi:Uncharacterized protein conserved in bacteria (DUF2065) [Shewanella morhuae]|uniref:Uncharacterized protein conserved in bacteria (DUF2065) n=2 Tax=Shewanella morhuae TaxID=365591 RepID=A0A380B7N0_9GAMM|nr:Uncharacterized protein conserved in bacteria (DUF2065) [Shewanella morhuae]
MFLYSTIEFGVNMTFQVFMLAVALVLILEGAGPLLFPNKWRRYLNELSQQNQHVIQRFGGILVTVGIVMFIIFT